jgi:ABC-type amino acid transport substrate-binding protein
MKSKLILVILSVIFISSATYRNAFCSDNQPQFEKTIVFGTIFTESTPFYNEMYLIYTEAFKRLGYNFNRVSLPGERAMVDANSGVVDGEAARIGYLESDKYPNLIRVAEPIIVIMDGAYSADTSIRINGWESLRGKGYKVGYIKGTKSVEQKLLLYVEKENRYNLTGFEQSLKMLQARRIDIFIISTMAEETAPMNSPAYSDIKRVGIVEEKILYPWLHKRHRELVSPLADTLKAMKADGTFQKLSEAAKLK